MVVKHIKKNKWLIILSLVIIPITNASVIIYYTLSSSKNSYKNQKYLPNYNNKNDSDSQENKAEENFKKTINFGLNFYIDNKSLASKEELKV